MKPVEGDIKKEPAWRGPLSLGGMLFVVLGLMGACSQQAVQNAQTVTLLTFQTACAVAAFADVGFQQAAAGPFKSKITASDIAQEQKWMGIVNSVCSNASVPKDITTAYNLLIAAQQAMGVYQTGGAVPAPPTTVAVGALPAS